VSSEGSRPYTLPPAQRGLRLNLSADNGIIAAGLLNLAAQKMKVIQEGAGANDYEDIHMLLSGGISLELAMGAARALYPEFNPAVSLKALSYFGDVANLPMEKQRDLKAAAAKVREIAQMLRPDDSLLPDSNSSTKTRRIEIEPDLEI
jgi:hypothetical protein